MIYFNSLLLIAICVLICFFYRNILNILENNENIDKLENDQHEILIETFNSYSNILKFELNNKYIDIEDIIHSSLQTLFENNDFAKRKTTEIIEDCKDIVNKIIDYNNINLTKSQQDIVNIIIKSMVRIFKINPEFCSKLIAS